MTLILGVYSQLSSGTPAPIMERALSELYKPLLTYLYKHPELRLHLYLPGPVMEWLEQNHPEVNMLIADLCKKEQLEMVTGGFQQPVLHILPAKDRSVQIEETTTFIRKRYGKRAKTIWFYNQIWNPAFVSTMGLCSVDRLIISPLERLHDTVVAVEPFVMQDMGKTIEVFPSHVQISEIVADLSLGKLAYKDFHERLMLINTTEGCAYETVMVNLDQLMEACAVNPSLPSPLDMFAQILEHFHTRVYPTRLLASLPVGELDCRGYLAAGWYGRDSQLVDISYYNQIFTKYDELNYLYGRTLYLMELSKMYRKNREVKKRVEQLLQKSVNGAPYVLDSSGGCYRSSYRKNVYKYLNDAEKLLATQEDVVYPREVDIDFDGHLEHVFLGKNISVVLDSKGGTLSSINYLPTGWNYADTFTGYAQEAERLAFSSLRDGSFQKSFNDVFLPATGRLDQFSKHNGKATFDTSGTLYSVTICDRYGGDVLTKAEFKDLPFGLGHLVLEKRYKFRTHTIVIEFSLTNKGDYSSMGYFGSELNLSIGTRGAEAALYTVEKSRNRAIPPGKVVLTNLKNVRIPDDINKTILSFASDASFSLCKDDFKVQLVTLVGLEVLYEYTQVLPLWEFNLSPGESFAWTLGFLIEQRIKPNSDKELA
jgi:4-alpha-glucanotransferase